MIIRESKWIEDEPYCEDRGYERYDEILDTIKVKDSFFVTILQRSDLDYYAVVFNCKSNPEVNGITYGIKDITEARSITESIKTILEGMITLKEITDEVTDYSIIKAIKELF